MGKNQGYYSLPKGANDCTMLPIANSLPVMSREELEWRLFFQLLLTRIGRGYYIRYNRATHGSLDGAKDSQHHRYVQVPR